MIIQSFPLLFYSLWGLGGASSFLRKAGQKLFRHWLFAEEKQIYVMLKELYFYILPQPTYFIAFINKFFRMGFYFKTQDLIDEFAHQSKIVPASAKARARPRQGKECFSSLVTFYLFASISKRRK